MTLTTETLFVNNSKAKILYSIKTVLSQVKVYDLLLVFKHKEIKLVNVTHFLKGALVLPFRIFLAKIKNETTF